MVDETADLAAAAEGIVSSAFGFQGQKCSAASRAIALEPVYQELLARVVQRTEALRIGPAEDPASQVAAVIDENQYRKVLDYIEIARSEGAACALGGGPATRPECGQGWFVEPTIFTDVRPDMRIAQEEVFGPVLGIIPFDDEEEAVAIANDSLYGLAAGVWTQSIKRALTMSERLEAGTVWVNTYRAVSYMMPFGGMKHSGFGRESGIESIREFLETKSVWISTSTTAPANPFVLR